MSIYALGDITPIRAEATYVAKQAVVVGRVTLQTGSSVWPGAVLRGDNEPIVVGSRSNVQDGAIVHTDPDNPVTIGTDVSIGHGAVLHGCRVGDRCLIGIRAIILNGSVISNESIVGAGALVTERKAFPPRSLILGSPARVVRSLTDDEVAAIKRNAQEYVDRAVIYSRQL